jgi:CubicO group peptidase (beta-lactamase class C family)
MWSPWKLRTLPACVALLATAPLVAQEIPQVVPEQVGLSSERLGRITTSLQRYVDDGRIAGAVAIVLRDGDVVYEQAVGQRDREAKRPMTTDAIFRIASQTKALVAVGIMMLEEDGKLLISDRVSKYLPEFEHTTVAEPIEGGGYRVVPARRQITIRDLMTHTSGIGYGAWLGRLPGAERWDSAGVTGWYFAGRDEPIRRTVERMAALPFPAQPGTAWIYGYNYDILGALIEAVSGEPLDEFLRERILEPLDMHDTYFYLPPAKRDRLAVVYGLRGGTLTRAPDGPGMEAQGQYVDGPRKSFSGGAGLLSTARDYSRFLQMLLNGGELDGHRLLSPTSVDLMTQNHVGNLYTPPGMGFGLGFRVRMDVGAAGERGSVGDYGWLGADHSLYWVDPVEHLVVVYLTQVNPAGALDDHSRMRALVYSAITEHSMDMMHSMMTR